MIDPQYLNSILEELELGRYSGVKNTSILKKIAPNEEDRDKFIYHMDEIWNAGLARTKNPMRVSRWGFEQHFGGSSINTLDLVLTPLGAEVRAELSKSKGFERFKLLIRTAGTAAGAQAFKVAIDNLLTQTPG